MNEADDMIKKVADALWRSLRMATHGGHQQFYNVSETYPVIRAALESAGVLPAGGDSDAANG